MLPYRSRLSVAVFLAPPLLLFGGGVLLPIVQSLGLSFYEWDGITGLDFVGLANYRSLLLDDDVFRTAFVNQLVYLVICLLLQVGGGLLAAFQHLSRIFSAAGTHLFNELIVIF